jgi:hypothetical protein
VTSRRARLDAAEVVPTIEWSAWWPSFARAYKVSSDSADHVTIIGPTGTGKTTLAMQVARLRRYVVVLGCKPEDRQLARLAAADGFYRIPDGELPSSEFEKRVLVWPQYRGVKDAPRQRDAFAAVFDRAFSGGGWHIVAEEAPHLIDLGMIKQVRQHLRMGRSCRSGLILCTQRPRGLPLEAISGAQHLLIFGTNDDEDLKRLGGMNGVSSALVRETVAGLGRGDPDDPAGRPFRFLHVDTRSGTLAITSVPPKLSHPPTRKRSR